MTLTVDAAQRQSIVPLQQSASSRLAGAFGPRFVTGSRFFIYVLTSLQFFYIVVDTYSPIV